jgi:FkbM family methyltransferase
LFLARRTFYDLGGHYWRNRIFEQFGSQRYAWPALLNLDRQLAEIVGGRPGTFVEAGAHDGFTQSNTYWLERHGGWSGLLVEPVPELARRATRRRPASRVVNCALVGPDYTRDDIEIHFGDLQSSVRDAEHAHAGLAVTGARTYDVTVPARTLSALLDDAGMAAPDLMVLDLEGHEAEALAGLDLRRHAPRYLMVEALDGEAGRTRFDAILGEHMVFDRMLTKHDLLYRGLSITRKP